MKANQNDMEFLDEKSPQNYFSLTAKLQPSKESPLKKTVIQSKTTFKSQERSENKLQRIWKSIEKSKSYQTEQ